MSNVFADWVIKNASKWLVKGDSAARKNYLYDFDSICEKIRIGDILLIEGNNRISTIIRHVTQSRWTHSVLYIGRFQDIEDPAMREIAKKYCNGDTERQMIIESEIGCGTIISSLTDYQDASLRVLRPEGLTEKDAQKVISFAIGRLGSQYNLHQLLDLARFIFPWGLFPRRWRSSLFQHNALQPTKDICSSMIADAFQSVDFPILPLIEEGYQNEIEFIRRNDRLYTPSDFDYSPYFDILKYPLFPLGSDGAYHQLPWVENAISDDDGTNIIFLSPESRRFFSSGAYAVIGASADRAKFGNKVLRCYLQKNKKVYPVNPHEKEIEGIPCISRIADLPSNVKSISIVTPPSTTQKIVNEAIDKGIKNIWMQPGAENALAIQQCKRHNINVIAGGPCILKELRFQE